MSAPRSLAALLLVLAAPPGGAADRPPEEPRAGGELLVPGRLPWGPTALPSGEILAPCEDQSLSVLDAQAQVVTRWTAGARFSGPVTVGPRGPHQLLAAPQVTGRFDVLVWDPVTRVLAGQFAAVHSAEAQASAWGASGTVFLAWKDGRIEAWGPRGDRLWSADLGLAVSQILSDEGLGLWALGPGQAVLVDPRGRETGRWTFTGTPRGVLQTMAGDLCTWTETGLWRKDADADRFRLFDPSPKLLGVVSDRQDRLILTEADRIRRIGTDGTLLGILVLPRPAVTASALDDRGRIVVGTEAGVQLWTYDGRMMGTLDPTPPASAPFLTDRGLAAWSSTDWRIHLWTGFVPPPFGWSQDGGGSRRPFSARRPASVAVRAAHWADDPDFGYFYQLVASGEEAKQKQALDQIEARAAQGNLLETWPWANLILLKIGRSGLTDLVMSRGRVVNNWPGPRTRAFTLLAQTAGPEDRDELMAVMLKEFDPAVASRGVLALARTGWDGDGKLMRLLYDIQSRMPQEAVVADACVEAARSLWLANGQSADPAMVPLVTSVFKGPFPRSVKTKAQTLFQDILEAP